MINIRLEGTPEELERYKKYFATLPALEILHWSAYYRNKCETVRTFLTTELKAPAESELVRNDVDTVELPFLIHVSNKYALIVFRDGYGKISKTYTMEIREAEERLKKMKEQKQNVR